MRERGFIQLPMLGWAAIAAGAVIVALGIALKVQTGRLDNCKDEHALFVAQTKALGDAQNERAKQQELADRTRKEKTDAEAAKTRRDMAGVYDAYRKLRDSNSRRSELPAAPSGSKRPDLSCFDRAEFARSVGIIEEGVPRITEQGDAATLDLNAARAWAAK